MITGFSAQQVAYVAEALQRVNKQAVSLALSHFYSKHLQGCKSAHSAVCDTLSLALEEYGIRY